MESETHKNLRYQAGSILGTHGWNYAYTAGGVSGIDIVARKPGRQWNIEIEYSGGEENIRADIRNGAHIFIAPADRLLLIEREVRSLGSRAPVVTISEFQRHVRGY